MPINKLIVLAVIFGANMACISLETRASVNELVWQDRLLAQAPGVPVRGASWGYNPGVIQYGAAPYNSTGTYYAPGYNPGTYYNSGAYYNPNAYVPPGTVYSAYPYSNYLGRYNIGGATIPVYGQPQLINGNFYGINAGGMPAQFWRAPSGFYYPWAPGYAYTNYPIYMMAPNSNTPTQTVPPVRTIISDLDNYLDKAKANSKISSGDYQSLRQRANDLLAKEKSIAYEEGGVIDPDQEAEIRRDVEGLSAEVARRVKP